MKKLIPFILILLFASFVSVSGVWAQDDDNAASGGMYKSRIKAYTAYFPIKPEPEKGKVYRNLDHHKKAISYITASYKSEELGTYIKYSINLEPLEQYKPYKDAVEEKIDEVINFYEERYRMRVASHEGHDKGQRWGSEIIIEFFDKDIPADELTTDDKPWVIRRLVFHEKGHIVVLEALGSESYVYSAKTDDFFDLFTLNNDLWPAQP